MMRPPVLFLVDVDNTLLDNDQVVADLMRYLEETIGHDCQRQYWEIFTRLREELGYADYLGALQRYRVLHRRDPNVLSVSSFLINYPFADRLFPRALEAIAHLRAAGPVVILSDGDVVFQPHKVERSGLRDAVDGVLIYVHKELELDDVERRYPADRYVFIDDKLRLLAAVKAAWDGRVTTVFPRQGHYALDPENLRRYPAADVTIEAIGELVGWRH